MARIRAEALLLLGLATAAGATKVSLPVEGATLNVGVQFQPWIQLTEKGAPDGESANLDLFIRRSRLMVNGDLGGYFSYLAQIDNPNFGKRGNFTGRVLFQDLWVGWAPTGIAAPTVVYVEAGLLMLPISRHLLQSTTDYTTLDVHVDSFRGMRETPAFRDTGVAVRGWAFDKRLGFRGGAYEGVRGTAGELSATNPTAGLNPHGLPRFGAFVNANLLGSEEGAWLYHGICWPERPILSVGLGGIYQSLSARAPGGVTDARLGSLDVFLDVPFGGDRHEVVLQATLYRNDYGAASKDTGWGLFVDLGYRYRSWQPYVSYELFSGDACPADADAAFCAEAQSADSRIFKAGVVWFFNKNLNNVRVEAAAARSQVRLSTPSVRSLTAQWNINF